MAHRSTTEHLIKEWLDSELTPANMINILSSIDDDPLITKYHVLLYSLCFCLLNRVAESVD